VGETANPFVSALDGVVSAGRYGRRTADPGVIVSEVREAGLATVTARKGRRATLIEAARSAFGVELPSLPRRVEGRDMAFIWSGPDQWLAYREPAPVRGMEVALAEPFAGLASITDQSHGRTLLRVTGPRVRDALAKGIAIDLHPREFKTGHAAVTAVAHIGVHLWQTDDRPTYELAVPRGLALSFWHWLEASAAEFGLEFAAAGCS
jgi:heterotetrameric sarcosine oxidase gamma subunit